MDIVTYSYVVYLLISVALTVWVARTLHHNGRIFLVEAFHGNEQVADSVNHLLVVGFYLINIGYITMALKYGDKPTNLQESFEFLSTKIGLVLLILGGMHFFNVFNFAKIRHKAKTRQPMITACNTAGEPIAEKDWRFIAGRGKLRPAIFTATIIP